MLIRACTFSVYNADESSNGGEVYGDYHWVWAVASRPTACSARHRWYV